MNHYIGIDIGGTKSAVVLIDEKGRIAAREQFPTTVGPGNWQTTMDRLLEISSTYARKEDIRAIGISCGGPLDSAGGIILSPPNLPGWDDVPITSLFEEQLKIPAYLENDANAGALAEWRFGAGRGHRNLIFLTFGTGLGAGLILDGKLYKGTSDLGGEIGHIRLEEDGPVGYHKQGSFEGFCSGAGLAQMMTSAVRDRMEQVGETEVLAKYKSPDKIAGKDVVEWAVSGDPLAAEIVRQSGTYLGTGLSILIDILNPELIIVGGMGMRLGDMLLEPAREVIARESLPGAATVCTIIPAGLGERIGDMAALCVALYGEIGEG